MFGCPSWPTQAEQPAETQIWNFSVINLVFVSMKCFPCFSKYALVNFFKPTVFQFSEIKYRRSDPGNNLKEPALLGFGIVFERFQSFWPIKATQIVRRYSNLQKLSGLTFSYGKDG